MTEQVLRYHANYVLSGARVNAVCRNSLAIGPLIHWGTVYSVGSHFLSLLFRCWTPPDPAGTFRTPFLILFLNSYARNPRCSKKTGV